MVEQGMSDIRIDKEGTWYHRGAEMFRKDIVSLFYRHLTKDPEGRYLIALDKERCYVDVEDTPFVIKSLDAQFSEKEGGEIISLLMPDESRETLDPTTLRIGKDNTLYCTIKSGFEARFNRSSYYQIAKYFEHDRDTDLYYLVLNGQRYSLVERDSTGR